ncbi:alpha/beta fold hydrolase [Pseudoalteromonas denitrificans]|uniref:Pimeloyl-ACP methyl ester carboxylesterase n=1 Tax=Pseudoalteromonas denitrificans DSM 6059 TaxID=1123010 RepID=A0A1I1N4L8_9GAMM|nr:alpha/beta hydrolase [Pseudoalteromonas denitrificans]SFC92296.1 Pimeloyl-ACP methyl ester carboxylesterase [Pseudoalteromonas denitrificans DSM 6059]
MKKEIYLLPGTMCTQQLWHKLVDSVHDEFNLNFIAIPTGQNLDEIVENLHIALPEQPAFIVGFSLGGYLASYFAAKYPDKVKKLFIISNSPCALNSNELKHRATVIKWIKQYGYSGISKKRAIGMVNSDSPNEDVVNTIIEMDSQLGEVVFKSQILATTERQDLSQKLIETGKKIVFYYSEFDSLVNKAWLAEHSERNRNSSLIVQAGSGHMLPLEQAHKLKCYLANWVKDA